MYWKFHKLSFHCFFGNNTQILCQSFLQQRAEPPQETGMDRLDEHSSSITHLIAERIRYQNEQRQHEVSSSIPAVVSFR